MSDKEWLEIYAKMCSEAKRDLDPYWEIKSGALYYLKKNTPILKGMFKGDGLLSDSWIRMYDPDKTYDRIEDKALIIRDSIKDVHYLSFRLEDVTWIPRLDQLINLYIKIGKDKGLDTDYLQTIQDFCLWLNRVIMTADEKDRESKGILQILFLTFLMRRLFGKKWNGDFWEKKI